MKKYSNELPTVLAVLIFVLGIFPMTLSAKALAKRPEQSPPVVKAVAPAFIPFVFGKPGSMTTVIEVKIDSDGKVREAHIVEFSLFRDKSFEETAKKWVFAPGEKGDNERTAKLIFVLRIMPKGTYWDDLTTVFTPPYQVEVRHEIFDPHINADPSPIH